MKQDTEWLSVREYAKRKGLKSPQVVYNWIDKRKLKEGVDWRVVEVLVKKKEVRYEE